MKLIATLLTAAFLIMGCGGEVRLVSAPGPAIVALEQLPVKGKAPKTGYSRDLFPHWLDTDGDGCSTREEILERDAVEVRDSLIGCLDVTIIDPYSGKQVVGRENIDIDHVVSLSNAWQTGAQKITPQQRRDFANDPTNLLAVSDELNQQKSDGDAATWLPPDKSFRCEFVARQITVKKRYELWITKPEYDAMVSILSTCPDQELIP